MYGDLDALMLALSQLTQPISIALLIGGIVIGLVIGILPGLGPPIAIALALPFTFYLDTVPSMILLLGIYSAAIYGGSISAIAVGIPGTGAAIATVQDGHKMFQAGRGGEALGLSLTGSIIGGLVSVVCLALISPLLAELAAKFGPREYLAISVFGLVVVVRVAGQSLAKGLIVGALGIFLTAWGLDEPNGTERYTIGSYHLYEGLPLVPFLVGLFAMSEVLIRAERALQKIEFTQASLTVKLPGWKTLGKMKDVLLRSSIIGTVIGIIPGEGAAVGAFFAYSEAKRRSNKPEQLGAGVLGNLVRKLGYSIAPLSIGFLLGPILENSLRQSLSIADGSVTEFFNSPIGLGIYAVLALSIPLVAGDGAFQKPRHTTCITWKSWKHEHAT